MGCVDGDVDKDVEGFDFSNVHWDETAVGVVNQQVTS